MSDPWPAQIGVLETPEGVVYRLPRRQLGRFHWVGLGLFLLGLVLCSAPPYPAWKVTEALRQESFPDEGILWLFALIVSFPMFMGGLALAAIGLFVWGGHSEIHVSGGMLRAVERCGWVHWQWDRPVAGLRRFFVGKDFGALSFFGCDRRGALAVITPEWRPKVGGALEKRMWLAPGYPRPWLLALAADLAPRCVPLVVEPAETAGALTVSPSVPTLPVLEREPRLSAYEELAEQPAGSKITVERSAERVTWTVPTPALVQNVSYFLGGLLACCVAWAITKTIFDDDPVTRASLGMTILFAGMTWCAGLALLGAGCYHFERQVVFTVAGPTLTVQHFKLFDQERRRWPREQIADVLVHYDMDSDGGHAELVIAPYPGEGSECRLLAHVDEIELRWLATMLRRALNCPSQGRNAPPPGFVVRGPWLNRRLPLGTPSSVPFRERHEQPPGSAIVVAAAAEGLTLTVPPLGPWQRSVAFLGLFGVFAFAVLMVLGLLPSLVGIAFGGWLVMVSVSACGCGGAFLVEALRTSRRCAVLTLSEDSLTVVQADCFGSKRQQWPRVQEADIRVGPVAGAKGWLWELQIVPKYHDPVGLLAGRNAAELQWLATVLRRAPRLPAPVE